MFDLKAYLIEFDTLMSETIEVLIKETANIYDEEIYKIILRTSKNIRNIVTNTSYDKIYNVYPFEGLNNIYNINIQALDEIKRLIYNLKQKDYSSLDINLMLAKLLMCEKNNLMAICKLYVPLNKQFECQEYLENNVFKRNLLKAITNNFYYLGVSLNPDLILYNIFENNLKEEYKIPVVNTILNYHYNGNVLKDKINEIVKLQLSR